MTLYADSTLKVIRSRKNADKEFDAFHMDASIENWDADLFFRLSMNKEVANALDQEHARILNQSLKTTIDLFN
ncbi:hypothetical protein C4J98_0702 [Pseudomonas orientalis]|uniref:hypothetical protein n=1 Tax=Pseudomonas orientalis TaxID=76758 RepID=UPI000F573622|nr:hypothetical protein [Pseudomonas orientalis]AZE82137.1 hypothetical protein C4J98_0702 [Pseudomonas orientalis]